MKPTLCIGLALVAMLALATPASAVPPPDEMAEELISNVDPGPQKFCFADEPDNCFTIAGANCPVLEWERNGYCF